MGPSGGKFPSKKKDVEATINEINKKFRCQLHMGCVEDFRRMKYDSECDMLTGRGLSYSERETRLRGEIIGFVRKYVALADVEVVNDAADPNEPCIPNHMSRVTYDAIMGNPFKNMTSGQVAEMKPQDFKDKRDAALASLEQKVLGMSLEELEAFRDEHLASVENDAQASFVFYTKEMAVRDGFRTKEKDEFDDACKALAKKPSDKNKVEELQNTMVKSRLRMAAIPEVRDNNHIYSPANPASGLKLAGALARLTGERSTGRINRLVQAEASNNPSVSVVEKEGDIEASQYPKHTITQNLPKKKSSISLLQAYLDWHDTQPQKSSLKDGYPTVRTSSLFPQANAPSRFLHGDTLKLAPAGMSRTFLIDAGVPEKIVDELEKKGDELAEASNHPGGRRGLDNVFDVALLESRRLDHLQGFERD